MSKKLLTIIMILCMVMGTGTLAYADVIPDYTGIDETETLIGEEETLEQGGNLNEEAQMSVVSANNENFVSVINSASTGDIIQVTGDITLEQAVTISGKSVTIKSNGGPWTITRGSTATGHLIIVDSGAGLTIENIIIDGNKDVVTAAGGSLVHVYGGNFTMNEGAVLQNNNPGGLLAGGGVLVGNGKSGSFAMDGGKISGNSSVAGGAVAMNAGTFTMSGGEISGNTASNYCGGVYVLGTGTFTMSGGEISGNTSSDRAGGVYVGGDNAKFNLSGAAKITGNTLTNGTESNVYLNVDNTITLTGALTDGASIGVNTYATPATGSPVTIARGSGYTITASDLAKFSSDSPDYLLTRADGEIQLTVNPESYVYYVSNGFTANDSNPGTSLKPVKTLARAFELAAAVTDDTVENVKIYIRGDNIETSVDLTMTEAASLSASKPVILATEPKSSVPAMIQRGSGVTGDLITVESGTGLTLENIIIDGNKDTVTNADGSLVNVKGNFAMKNGAVLQNNNAGSYSGGVLVGNSGSFTMDGGKISGNTSSDGGGGVAVGTGGTFAMSGGEISDNSAYSGGGVYAVVTGEFTMSGGEISGNTASYNGGGVYLGGNANFNLSGAARIIENTKTDSTANNVYLPSGKTITLTGALRNGASIGVNTEATVSESSAVTIAKAGTAADGNVYKITISDRAKFSSDVSGYYPNLDTSGNESVITLSTTEQDLIATIPTGKSLTYNGNPQTGVEADTGYILTGNKETEAGNYTATATLEEDCKWEDGTTDPITINWSIAQKDPVKDDFKITGITNKVYDGAGADVKVELKNTYEGAGAITVKYYKDGNVVQQADTKNTGTYTVKFAVAEGKNFKAAAAEIEAGTFTVSPKSVTITGVKIANKDYDGTNTATIENAGDVNGKVGNDDVTVSKTGATATFDNKNAGDNKTVAIEGLTLTGTAAGNYVLSGQPTGVTGRITRKPLTITADDKVSKVGKPLVELTYSAPGLVIGDTITGALATDANNGVPTEYDITRGGIAVDDGNGGNNYEITFVGGKYTVTNKDIQTIAFANSTVTKTYGDAAFTNEASRTAGDGEITYTSENPGVAAVNQETGEVTILKAGEAKIVATAAATENYEEGSAAYTLKVEKKTLTITAENKTVYVGGTLPQLTYKKEGLVNGDTVETEPVLEIEGGNPDLSSPGTYNIIVTGGQFTNSDSYNVNYVNGTLTVSQKSSGGGGGGGGSTTTPSTQVPIIEAGEGVKVTLSTDGTTATITAETGYEIEDVVLNGASKGAVTTVSGLKTGDKLAVTAAKKSGAVTEEEQKKAEAITSFKPSAKSKLTKMKSGKKAIRITWTKSEYDFDGVEVWRSTKRNSGYGKKPMWTIKAKNSKYYYNTAIKKGKTYYYKLRGYVEINGKKYYTPFSNKVYRTVK